MPGDDLSGILGWLGVVAHAFKSSSWGAEAGGLRVQCEPELYSETMPQQ